jgi:hypothetical protein
MEAVKMTRSFNFWVLTLMSAINVMIVILHAIHQRDPWVRLPLFTILLAVIMIWIVSASMENGFARVREQVGEKASRHLQNSAHSLSFMANLAILSALPFLR